MTMTEKRLAYIKKKYYELPHLLGNYLGYNDLNEHHSKWIRYIWHSSQDRTLQAFRGSYKTTAVVVIGVIWYLLYHFEARILICREEYSGARASLEEIWQHYRGEKMASLYKTFFNVELSLPKENSSCLVLPTKKKVTKEGNIECTGVGGSITGRHYDRIITDDIITLKDRISNAKREQTIDFVRELRNIKNVDGTLSNVGTPWHKNDAFSVMPAAKKYPIGSVDIRGLTEEKINELKRGTTQSLYAANYELKHIADLDKVFTEAKYETFSENEICIAVLDPAYGGECTTALTVGYIAEEKIHIKGWVWPQSVVSLYSEIVKILSGMRIAQLYVEVNADKGASVRDISMMYSRVEGYHEHENKHIKIVSYCKKQWHRVYFAHDCQEDYIAQVLDYTEGQKPDDAPDTLASFIRILLYQDDEVRVL
jgi:hypothetical protein